MEISQLNALLATLSPSERRYRDGEAFPWHELGAVQSDGDRRALRLPASPPSDIVVTEDALRVSGRPPLGGMLGLRRNSRFNPVPEHVHSHIELSYVYAGTCPQRIDGRDITLRENQVLLLDTDCPHAVGALGQGDITMSLVLSRGFLRESLLGAFACESILSQFTVNALNDRADHNRYVLFHTEESRRIRRFFQELMCEYLDPSIVADRVILNLLQLLFAELIRVYESDFDREGRVGGVSVVEIVRYIEEHYRDLTQERVAEHFSISPNYVSVLLKRHTGMTYMQAVQAQRLGRAASLLRNSDLPVDEVAREVGYENLSFFYRKFRAANGCSPAEYRSRWLRQRAGE